MHVQFNSLNDYVLKFITFVVLLLHTIENCKLGLSETMENIGLRRPDAGLNSSNTRHILPIWP